MADLFIGVNVKDAQTLTFRVVGVENAPVDTAGFLVYSVRGIDDVMVFKDFNSAKNALGGFNSDYYGMYAIKGFFDNANPGATLFVKRLIDTATAIAASYIYNDQQSPSSQPALKFTAGFRGNVDRGTWGNNIRVSLVHEVVQLATLTAAASIGSTSVQINSLEGFEKYDIIKIEEGSNSDYIVLEQINEANNSLVFSPGLTNSYTSAAVVYRIRYSVYVYYVDPATSLYSLVEQFTSLSSNPSHSRYIENVINNIDIGSSYITVDVLTASASYNWDTLPAPDASSAFASGHYLTGGYNGSNIPSSNLQNYYKYFNLYPIRFVGTPEFFGIGTNSSYDKGESYADEMKDRIYIHNLYDLNDSSNPASYDSFDEIINQIKPRRKSKRFYSMIFKDWIYVEDPLGTILNPYKKVPILGHIVGYMVNQIKRKGVHRVPANTIQSINGIVSISNEVIDRSKLTDMVETGINVVSKIGSGFFLRSSRTISLNRVERYINVLTTLIYIKESLKGIMVPYENTPTQALPQLARNVILSWAKNFYKNSSNNGGEGGFGEGTFEEVFKVIVDESVNPKPQLAEGIVKALVYFVPPSAPSEKILLEVGLIDLL